jgi:hypothetical protein
MIASIRGKRSSLSFHECWIRYTSGDLASLAANVISGNRGVLKELEKWIT